MKNPFKKENFIRVGKDSDEQAGDKTEPQFNLEELYTELSAKYDRDHNPETYEKLMQVYNELNKKRLKSVPQESVQVAESDPVVIKAREIVAKIGKNFDDLSDQKQKDVLIYAQKELDSASFLKALTDDMEDPEVKQLKEDNAELNDLLDEAKIQMEELRAKREQDKIIIQQQASQINILEQMSQEGYEQDEKENEVEAQELTVESKIKSDNQIAYDLIKFNKKNKESKIPNIKYEIGNLELYCLSCKHTIHAHAKNGESNGCNKCGCLRTITEIAKENKVPLITRKQYQQMSSDSKEPNFITKNFLPKKELRIDETQEIAVDSAIIKQAKALQSMITTKKPKTKIETRADQLQKNTQSKLKEESQREKDLKEVSDDTCTCSHKMNEHFESGGFCTTLDCPCDSFREYPQ